VILAPQAGVRQMTFLASALAKGSLIRVYKPIAQLSLFGVK